MWNNVKQFFSPTGVVVPNSLTDIQVKEINEFGRRNIEHLLIDLCQPPEVKKIETPIVYRQLQRVKSCDGCGQFDYTPENKCEYCGRQY